MEPITGRRDSFYRGMGFRPPGFAYGMAPSYGIWDTLFWFMILDRCHRQKSLINGLSSCQ